MSADLEREVLGLAMHSRNNLDDLTDVTPDDFTDTRHAALYRLIRDLDRKGEPFDSTSLARAYKRIPEDERRGIDPLYILDCWRNRPVDSLADKKGRELIQAATRRRLDDALIRGRQLIESEMDPSEVAELVRGEIESANRATAQARPIGHIIDRVIENLDKPAKAHATPWPDLNDKLIGWRAGALYVVGARPGVGKSIVALQAALGLTRHGWVAFNSLEMPEDEIVVRAIAQLAEVPLGRMQGRTETADPLTARDWDKIAKARGVFADMRLSIEDRASVTVTDIKSHARTLARKPGGLAAVVVDYLQLMSAARGDRRPRHEIVADFSRQLKLLAKDLQVPVIALSQLNRASEARQDKRPVLADLRESGAVEQDADVVLLLHTDDETATDMDMLVAKNRHGTLGPVRLTRRGEFARVEPRGWTPAHHHYPDN